MTRENRRYIETLESQVVERTKELELLLQEKESYIRTIHDDLVFARMVQSRLLQQSMPSFGNIDICARYVPCGLVGGDFYQAVALDDHTVALMIFDVSGHGLAAALVTAVAKSAFDLALRQGGGPAEILSRVNTDIYLGTPDNMFITAFLMLLDRESGIVRFSSAGHAPPLVRRAYGGTVEELICRGTFLGIMKELRLSEGVFAMEDGDRVLMYTDGLVEAMDVREQMYGRKRLKQLLESYDEPGPSHAMIRAVMQDNEQFLQGELRTDDLCMLALQWHQPQGST